MIAVRRVAQGLELRAGWIVAGAVVVAIVALFLGPQFLDAYTIHLVDVACLSVMTAIALNLLFGYTGQVSVGQAAFYAIGAYMSAYLEITYQLSFWETLPIAAAAAYAVGVIVGIPTMRLKDHFLAMATLGLGLIAYIVLVEWKQVTKGDEGLGGFHRPDVFGGSDETNFYYVVVAFTVLTILVAIALVRSRYGLALKTIREDETASRSLGIPTRMYKVQVFGIAAGLTAIAGSLGAHLILFVSPEGYDINASISILAAVVVGGLGSIGGAMMGGILVALLPSLLFSTARYSSLAFGVLMALIVLFLPGGLITLVDRIWRIVWSWLVGHEVEGLVDQRAGPGGGDRQGSRPSPGPSSPRRRPR